jgi:hypothetical protein
MRPRPLLVAVALTLAIAGCSSDSDLDRRPGDPITQAEAGTLAELLHRDFTHGGAGFVVSAPYGGGVVLTVTGDVDFRDGVGRAQAVTSFADGRADDVRTLFFSHEEVWVGDVPGLAQALAADGARTATYLRRPLTTGGADGPPALLDVALEIVLNLAAPTSDDRRAFLDDGYTWQGQRSIDSRLTSLFGLPGKRTIAVAASDDLLTQFVTPLPAGDVDVTVTLSDHGPRQVDVPAADETAEAADHPRVAADFGV